jgi:hypothetical protein
VRTAIIVGPGPSRKTQEIQEIEHMHMTLRAMPRLLIGGGIAASTFLFTASLSGQAPARQAPSPGAQASQKNHFIETPKGWVHPVTPWGDPDIQGMFNFSYVGTVPLERCGGGGAGRAPAELVAKAQAAAPEAEGGRQGGGGRGGGGGFGGRGGAPCDPNQAWKTDEVYKQQVANYEKQQAGGDRFANALKEGDLKTALGGITDPTTPQRQTSLVMDPPDGRLPALTAEGNRRMMLMRSSWSWYNGEPLVWDAPEDFDVWDRCITRGLPASMGPYRYNNGMEIIQAPGYVVLNLEMIHEARMIPVDGRAKVSPAIKQWLGESRGRWEGNTLVIETTNFKAGASMTNIGVAGSPQGNRIPTSEQMTITERITRLNNDDILYEITTEDPTILTKPWTARFPLKNDPSYEWWEYACHEGNTAIPNFITSSRAERAEAAKAGGQPAAPAGGRGGSGR